MAVTLSPVFNGWQGFGTDGLPLSGGLLYTYQAGTSTPQATYTTNSGLIANTNPIVLGADGRPPQEIWLTLGQAYRFVLQTALAVQIATYDNITGSDAAGAQLRVDLADSTNISNGDALVAVKQPETGAVGRTQHQKNSDRLSLLDFGAAGSGGDDTSYFQLLVNTHKSGFIPKGVYNVTTVNIDVYGCDLLFDKEATVNITGNGFYRNLLQTPRATFIAANSLLDATNYYYALRIRGGLFNVAANATAISDRVPFLVNTGASPSQVLLQRPTEIFDVNIVLAATTSTGIGLHGGWGPTVRGGTIEAAGIDALAISIGGSSADGDTHCQPQEILIDGVTFNTCKPFLAALNGCTNSCEGLTVRGCWFNFVRLAELTGVNSLRWTENLFVTDVKSLDIIDSPDVLLANNYFESDHDPDNSAKPGIVNIENCSDTKVIGNAFNVLATSSVTARDGILIKANSSNAMRGVDVSHNRFQHAAFNVTLETNAIRFATAGGSGQILDITIKDNTCNDWHNAINFTDHITNLATGLWIENVSNSGGLRFLKGIARIATNSLRAPGLWEQFSLVVSANSIGGGTTAAVGSDYWPTVMRSAAPVVTVTNFTNLTNANGIAATWAAIGANSVHIAMTQTAASVAGSLVQGSATITVDGTLV